MGVVPVCEHDVQLAALFRHVWHVELHAEHTPRPTIELKYWPTAHVAVHVPAPELKSAPATQPVQPLSLPSEHVAHDASHATQLLVLASAYLPLGQLATHEESSRSGVPLLGHVRHAELCAAEQVSHDEWQLEHVACVPMSSTKVPLLGHAATHCPLVRNGALVPLQLMHSVLAGPLHVPHEGSQLSHMPLALAYLPTGAHEDMQAPVLPEPSKLKNGVAAAQEVQSVADGPEHTAQVASHDTQVSADVEEPPAHVKPSSIAPQSPRHPSRLTVLPSSQISEPTRRPSPQTAVQASGVLMEPPEQINPASI